jgi:hypothetical protein
MPRQALSTCKKRKQLPITLWMLVVAIQRVTPGAPQHKTTLATASHFPTQGASMRNHRWEFNSSWVEFAAATGHL